MIPKYWNSRYLLNLPFSALLLAIALLLQRADAQLCQEGFAAGLIVSPGNAHIGDSVNLTLEVVSDINTCQITNGRAWIVYPDNSSAQWLDNFTLNANASLICPGGSNCLLGVQTSYTVRTNDLGAGLTFKTNLPSGFSVDLKFPGQSNTIQFAIVAIGPPATEPKSIVQASITRAARVVFPGVNCSSTCTGDSPSPGTVAINGIVTNSGDVAILNIGISNIADGAVTLITNIPSIPPGGAASFSGQYAPQNSCLPATNIVIVRAFDSFGLALICQSTNICSVQCHPAFKNIAFTGSQLVLASSGPPNASFSLVTATNLNTAASLWEPIFTNHFGGDGNFTLTNQVNANELTRYFRLLLN